MKKLYLFIVFSLFSFVFTSVVFWQSQQVSVEIRGQWLIIWTPANLNLGFVSDWATITRSFLDYFWIEDLRGTNTGHYTTIQCDGIYGPNGATSSVITGIQLSWTSIERILWTDNNTLIYSNLSTWTDITTPQLYLYRNNNISNGWVWNRYGNKPSIKIIVPSGTPAGTYKGKITYTLYDMPFSY